LPTGKEGSGCPLRLSGEQQIAFKIDRKLLLSGRSIGGLPGLVKKYFAAVLHRKAGAGDTVGQGGWIGGRSFEKAKLNFRPLPDWFFDDGNMFILLSMFQKWTEIVSSFR
jgi:hypothetical protein